jgi:outer membrane protein assembly factor BamA
VGLDLYFNDETYHLISTLGYQKYPDKFWGFGNDVPESNEEDFTSRRWQLNLEFQRRINPGIHDGIQFETVGSEVIETETGGLLGTGGIPGNVGASASGAGFILNWDTRDNIYYPFTGRWFQLSARFYGEGLGSEYSFSRYNLDLRQYLPIRSTHALAIQAYGLFMTGTPPFELMPRLGGPNMMRGYYQGRYSDRNMIAVQAEYRRPIRGRLGAVCFVGLGDVAAETGDFRLGDFKHAFGLGLRFLFSPEERINLRLDWAWGKDTSGMYINLMEAF